MDEKQEPNMKKKARPVVLGEEKYKSITGKDEEFHDSPWPGLVLLYARLWLHRYNFLLGENLVLSRTRTFSETLGGCVISDFSMFFEAEDPDKPHSRQTFLAEVDELRYRTLLLNCYAVSGSEKDPIKKSSLAIGGNDLLLPELPSENPFQNTNRFYVLDESEQQARDWVQLYLDLAVAIAYMTSEREDLTDLKIIQVSVEPTQDPHAPNQEQNVFDITYYIRYHDPSEDRVGKDHDRIAIVRRILNKNSGELILAGCNESSHSVIPCEVPVGKDADVTDENIDELARLRRRIALDPF